MVSTRKQKHSSSRLGCRPRWTGKREKRKVSIKCYRQKRTINVHYLRKGCTGASVVKGARRGRAKEAQQGRRERRGDTKKIQNGSCSDDARLCTQRCCECPLQRLEIDDFTFLELFVRRSFRRGSRSRLDLVHVDPSTIEGADRVASRVDLWANIL